MNSFENLCRFCLSYTENSSVSLHSDKILIRLQNKIIDLKRVLKTLQLDSVEKEIPHLVCDECKIIIVNFHQLQKTYRENELLLLEKSSPRDDEEGDHNKRKKEELLKTVDDFYREFEAGDELNIIRYRDKLVIEKLQHVYDAEEKLEYLTTEQISIAECEIKKLDQKVEIEQIANDVADTNTGRKRKLINEVVDLNQDETSIRKRTKDTQCEDCSLQFQSEIAYQKHMSYHFLSKMSKLFSYHDCHTCRIIFGTIKEFDTHVSRHSEDSNFVYKFEGRSHIDGCEILSRGTEDRIRKSSDSESWTCGHCNLKFSSKIEANFHLTLFHANCFCPFCKQSFGKSVPYLVNHLKLKHPEKFDEIVFNCSFCNESFSLYNEMKMHEKACDKKKFSCNHCHRKFSLERQLKDHLDSINGQFKFSCDDCEKLFTNKAALTVHKR
jgi:hypothetical protein